MLAAHRIMFLESSLFTVAVFLCTVICGLFAGGIVYGIAWRMSHPDQPEGGSWRKCPDCGATFTTLESVPVLGWALHGGVCSHCGTPIAFALPASQMLCAGVFGSLVLRHGITLQTLELLVLACVLMVVSLTSVVDYRVPNVCILAAFCVRIAFLSVLYLRGEDVISLAATSAVGAAALGLPLFVAVWLSDALLARDVNGMGTVKLVAVVGFYLGWQQGLFAVAGAIALWLLVWLVSPSKLVEVEVEGGALDHDADGDRPSLRDMRPTHEEDIAEPMRLIPFAPAIIIGLWVLLLVGVTPAVWSSPII